jgi:hypothetical protein
MRGKENIASSNCLKAHWAGPFGEGLVAEKKHTSQSVMFLRRTTLRGRDMVPETGE